MKFLLDNSPKIVCEKSSHELVAGQLITPLTRYSNWGGMFAIDNGAFSGFDERGFASLLSREKCNIEKCEFVVVPDIVGSARRTLELFRHRDKWIDGCFWPLAFVAQDGAETLDVPWNEFAWLFIGGKDPWKDSQAATDLVKTAKILGKQVHVGRVNTAQRFNKFDELGCDTCDGSGLSLIHI